MSENISIDDIIRQAEEIRKKTVAKAQNAIEEVKAEANAPTEEKEVKEYTKKPSTDKTSVIEGERLKKAEKTGTDDKTKAVRLEQKTSVVPHVNAGKKSFFKTNTNEPIYSKTPPEIIERPATIKSKSRLDRTSDLEEIPTIVAVDELEHTKISIGTSPMPKHDEEEYISDEGEQIVLDGFDDDAEKISKIDEDVAEEQLKRRRQEKVNKFRLFSPDDISEGKVQSVKNEFKKNDDKTIFMEKLFASKSSFTMKAVFTLIIAIPLLLLYILKDTAYLPGFLLDLSHKNIH